MKHKKQRLPDTPWTKERVEKQISGVKGNLKELHSNLNFYRSKEQELYQMQIQTRQRISDKAKYLNQLEKQLQELENDQGEHILPSAT